MIKGVIDRFDDYSILLKIRQMLWQMEYDLVEDDLLWSIFLFI